MKVEVIECSTNKTIEIYSVTDLNLIDFQGWEELSKDVIHLDRLSDTVRNLESKDSETQEPLSFPKEVDFYLPDPLKDRVFSRLAKSQTNPEESPDQFADILEEFTEQASTPELKLSAVLSAVVTEILQNHTPHSDYQVRISE